MGIKQTTKQEWGIIKKLDAEKKYGPLRERLVEALSTHDYKSVKKILLEAKVICSGWVLSNMLGGAIEEAGVTDKEILQVANEVAKDYVAPPKAGLDLGGVSITVQRADEEDGPKIRIDSDSR